MSLEHRVQIERLAVSDGSGYLATVPDLPGCMSDEDSPEEALKNVQDAIGSWIEAATQWGMPVPEPSRALEPDE
jgi:predicted RNase H-like HicB family nuclease